MHHTSTLLEIDHHEVVLSVLGIPLAQNCVTAGVSSGRLKGPNCRVGY